VCCGNAPRSKKNKQQQKVSSPQTLPQNNKSAQQFANNVTTQMMNQLAIQQRMLKNNPNNYLNRYM
jgi:hypothetical protein